MGEAAMAPEEIRSARLQLGQSQAGLAALLKMGRNGSVKIRKWEAGEEAISGPASVAIEALLSGWRPSSDGSG